LLNFVVQNQHWFPEIEPDLFGTEHVQHISPSINMLDILVQAGFFSSKGQARKNWHGERDIPLGFNVWIIGKHREVLAIWNPMPQVIEG